MSKHRIRLSAVAAFVAATTGGYFAVSGGGIFLAVSLLAAGSGYCFFMSQVHLDRARRLEEQHLENEGRK
jgi:hypothetical protein